MRSPEELERRLQEWVRTKAQFFPDPYIVALFDSFIEYLGSLIGRNSSPERNEARFWKRFEKGVAGLAEAGSYLEFLPDKARSYLSNLLLEELAWITGRDDVGALRLVVWDILCKELHDAECAMRGEGPDIVLEGKGAPPDFVHRGRTFRFWLRLKHAQLRDERSVKSAIEVIWLLYGWKEEDRIILEAQDDTLSGLLTFSGDDYDFRIWDHVTSHQEGQVP